MTPPALMKAYQRWWVREEVPFHGHYTDFGEVPDENPWAGPYWQSLSKEKLRGTLEDPKVRVARGDLLELVPGYYAHLALLVNQLSRQGRCSVLDFGGGTGLVYYYVRPGLTNRQNVSWRVIDNPDVTAMGEAARSTDDPLRFDVDLSGIGAADVDVLYLNTVLQYVPDYEGALHRLLAFAPRYVVLTRLLAGPMPTYVVRQVIGGLATPCRFINFHALTELFEERGYGLEALSQGDPLDGQFAKDVPEELRIPYDLTAIFVKLPTRAVGEP